MYLSAFSQINIINGFLNQVNCVKNIIFNSFKSMKILKKTKSSLKHIEKTEGQETIEN